MADLRMLFPGGIKKVVTLSFDDGVEQDKELLRIANKYGLKGTFNINSGLFAEEGHKYPDGTIHRRMSKSEVIKTYSDCSWEIAAHGYTHPFLEQLPTAVAAEDILMDRRSLEEIFDRYVRGFAYPYGTYNDNVVEMLKNAGIVYARTVNSTHNYNIPRDWLRLNPTCHYNDPELDRLMDGFINEPWGNLSMFYMWGHAYEFEQFDSWDVIEKFGKIMGGREDTWYATNIEVYDYVDAYSKLLFTANMDRAYNPTNIKIWFAKDGKTLEINPGETIKF